MPPSDSGRIPSKGRSHRLGGPPVTVDDPYAAVRRDEYSTLGDAYRMCRQDPEAFAAGAQYALDRITGNSGPLSDLHGPVFDVARQSLRLSAAETLQRALDGEPQ